MAEFEVTKYEFVERQIARGATASRAPYNFIFSHVCFMDDGGNECFHNFISNQVLDAAPNPYIWPDGAARTQSGIVVPRVLVQVDVEGEQALELHLPAENPLDPYRTDIDIDWLLRFNAERVAEQQGWNMDTAKSEVRTERVQVSARVQDDVRGARETAGWDRLVGVQFEKRTIITSEVAQRLEQMRVLKEGR